MITTPAPIRGQIGPQNPTGNDAFKNLDLNAFLAMLIAELQNQDPLSPMENSELLQQVSQIREIESNIRLVTTLESLTRAQNMTSGAALIGKRVTGITEAGKEVSGVVDKLVFENQQWLVYVGDEKVSINNIAEVAK